MKIVDNSLCNIDFSRKATENTVQQYIISLFESAVDLVEIDYKSVEFLQDINTSKRFIFRAECISDLKIAENKEFAYVIIPYNMISAVKMNNTLNTSSDYKNKNVRYIVEIDGENRTNTNLLSICQMINNLRYISGIRLVKNFSNDNEDLTNFIDEFYAKFNMILDICPLNSNLTGLDAAYKAFSKNVNMITLSYSSNYFYTPYELFVMYFPKTLGLNPQGRLLPFLLICAAKYSVVSDSYNKGLKNLTDLLDNSGKIIFNTDYNRINSWEHLRVSVKKQDYFDVFTNTQNSYFESLNLKKEECYFLANALDDADLTIYNRYLNHYEFTLKQ